MILSKVKVADYIAYIFVILFAGFLISKITTFPIQSATFTVPVLEFWLISISGILMLMLLLIPKTRIIWLIFSCSCFIGFTFCILLMLYAGVSLPAFYNYLWFSVNWKVQLMVNALCIIVTCLAIKFKL